MKDRKRRYRAWVCLFLAMALLAQPVQTVYATEQSVAEERVLFVGNSFTYQHSLYKMFVGIARAKGRSVKAGELASRGYSLTRFADEADEYGEMLAEELGSGKWDYVVIQAKSTEPLTNFENGTLPAARTLVERARENGVKPVFYMTWGFQNGYSKTVDRAAMTEALTQAYYRMGSELQVPVAAVGQHFMRADALCPDIGLFDTDGMHPSYAGSYLAACTIYSTIYQDSALGTGFFENYINEEKLDIGTAWRLQQVCDTRLELGNERVTMNIGEETALQAAVRSTYGDDVTPVYASSDETVVQVEPQTGVLTALALGEAWISVTTQEGLSALVQVRVTEAAARVRLTEQTLDIACGNSHRLTPQIETESAFADDRLLWSSEDETVAAVDAFGVVTAKAPGKTWITVRTASGLAERCEVLVRLAAPEKIRITKSKAAKGRERYDLTLTWQGSEYAEKYLVYRKTASESAFRKIAEVTEPVYLDSERASGIRYQYAIRASLAGTQYRSVQSETADYLIPVKTYLSAAVRYPKSGKVRLTWRAQRDISGYCIYRAEGKNGTYELYKVVRDPEKTGFTDSRTNKKRAYFYKIRAYKTINERDIYGAFSDVQRVKGAN